MNYTKLYDNLINTAIRDNRVKSDTDYYELHHIIPRCLNGSDLNENLVLLTAREHFLAHWMLTKIYKNDYRLIYAFNRFSQTNKGLRGQRSRLYKYAREKYIFALKHNDEWKIKMSRTLSKLIWIKNKITGDCLRISKDSLDDFIKEGFELGRIIKNRKKHSQKGKLAMSRARQGIILSKLHKENISKSIKNRLWINNKKICKFVSKEEAETLYKDGWKKGRIKSKNTFGQNKGKKWINKDGIIKGIFPYNLMMYLESGWKLGKGIKVK